jgi:hypothetical protein
MKKQTIKSIFYIAFFMTSVPVIAYAEAIVVEGAVPNEASKQVFDKIQVRAISAPNGWSDSVIKVITRDLKLAESGIKILDEMAVALNKVAGKKVKVIGHTDSSGDPAKNLALSQKRAVAVKNYLIGKNIPTNSLSVEGLGSNKPVADNTTAEGRKKNRRIEFKVL